MVPISFDSRRVGDITVVYCRGHIVEGAESIALSQCLDDLLPYGRDLILHLGGVDFIDSSGLGLLVRYLTRMRNAHGLLKLCAVSPRIVDVLKVTHLNSIFESFDSEADAIRSFYAHADAARAPHRLRTDILCVSTSADVQAYVRELLSQAGYGILTAGNLPDALILLQATRPTLVVIDAQLRATRDTHTADKFNTLADTVSLIELAAGFSSDDAGDAGRHLLEQVRARMIGGDPPPAPAAP